MSSESDREHDGEQQSGDHASDHSHAAHEHGDLKSVSDVRLFWAVLLNELLTIGQVVAGIISGSVSLLSDAAHNFNDANALLIAYIARRVSRNRANQRYTFGYRRAEMIGALINLTLLAVVSLFLAYEGIMRLFEPEHIIGWLMATAALLALVLDLGTVFLLWDMRQGSLNVRAAFIHNLVDALGSLAVLIGGLAVIFFNWVWVDAALTLMISGYVLWQVYRMLPAAIKVLMEGTPEGLDLDQLIARVESIDGVQELHHLHAWELDEQHRSLEAHVVIAQAKFSDMEAIKSQIKELLARDFGIEHTTLEFETEEIAADDAHDAEVIPEH